MKKKIVGIIILCMFTSLAFAKSDINLKEQQKDGLPKILLGVKDGLYCGDIWGATSDLCNVLSASVTGGKIGNPPYLYNNSNSISFNETKLNTSIDIRIENDYLNLSGTNANQNINISPYNISTTGYVKLSTPFGSMEMDGRGYFWADDGEFAFFDEDNVRYTSFDVSGDVYDDNVILCYNGVNENCRFLNNISSDGNITAKCIGINGVKMCDWAELESVLSGTGNSTAWNRSGTNVILANTGDYVGINVTPNKLFHVGGNTQIDGDVTFDAHNVYSIGESDKQLKDIQVGSRVVFDSNTYINSPNSDEIALYVGGLMMMKLDESAGQQYIRISNHFSDVDTSIGSTKGQDTFFVEGSSGNVVVGVGGTATYPFNTYTATGDTIANFESGDDKGNIRIADDDTSVRIVAKDGFCSIGANNDLSINNPLNLDLTNKYVGMAGQTVPTAMLDFGTGSGNKELYMYHSGNYKYGFRIPDGNIMRSFVPTGGSLVWGEVSNADGDTFTEGMRLTGGDLDVSGNFTGNQFYVQACYHNETATELNFAVQDKWYNMTWNEQLGKDLNGFSSDGTHTLTCLVAGLYSVNHRSTGSGQNNHMYASAMAVNGVPQVCTVAGKKMSAGGDVTTLSGTGLIRLAENDLINLVIKDHSGIGTGDYYGMNLNLVRIGN